VTCGYPWPLEASATGGAQKGNCTLVRDATSPQRKAAEEGERLTSQGSRLRHAAWFATFQLAISIHFIPFPTFRILILMEKKIIA